MERGHLLFVQSSLTPRSSVENAIQVIIKRPQHHPHQNQQHYKQQKEIL